MSILNSSGPIIDPWGTPHKISNSLLNEEPTLTFVIYHTGGYK